MTRKSIAHYQIRRELGRGGMGIVYEAEDTKLHRLVALKVLSPHLLSSEDDRARFYREARSAAALNHPNIATIHAVDEVVGDDGEPCPFIAMEYIEGRTLRQTIDDGPLKIDEAIRITAEAARALAKAHSKEIVHRDIKSANLMITSDGSVKVLDFGLAKSAQSTMLTKTGSTLGTAAYMSPEQARTMDVDGRSDIWSLGVVLYEMVAGKLPFGAAYEQAVVYSILNADPEPLTAVRTGVPMELERIVTKCLMKDPGLRYQHADDLVADLSAVQLGHTGMSTTTLKTTMANTATTGADLHRQPRRLGWTAVAIGVILGLVAGGAAMWLWSDGAGGSNLETNLPVHHLTLDLPDDAPFEPVGEAFLGVGVPALDISDDGRLLVYLARRDDRTTQLYLRELDSREARPLAGTEGATNPIFSPDGDWIAFRRGSRLMKISTNGGSPLQLGEAPETVGGDWTSDGWIWLTPRQGLALVKYPSGGGDPETIDIKLDAGRKVGELPDVLPGGEYVFVSRTTQISLVPGAGGPVRVLLRQGSHPSLTPSGHLVYALPGRLMAVPFDLESLSVTGSPVPVVEGVRTEVVRRTAQYTFSKTGTLVYAAGSAADLSQLTVVGLDGVAEPLPFEPDYFGSFVLSPDGTKLAANTLGSSTALWIYDLERLRRRRVDNVDYCSLLWTHDSKRLITCRVDGDRITSIAVPADGGEPTELLTSEPELIEGAATQEVMDLSSDGRFLATEGRSKVHVYQFDGNKPGSLVLAVPGSGWGPRFSPNAAYLSYTSLENAGSEIYVMALDGSGRTWQISDDGGEEALWSQDGRWVFYSKGHTWYRVPVSTESGFSHGEPEVAFSGPYLNVPGFGYSVLPEGNRFIVLESVNPSQPIPELHVVENWFEELERLVPTR